MMEPQARDVAMLRFNAQAKRVCFGARGEGIGVSPEALKDAFEALGVTMILTQREDGVYWEVPLQSVVVEDQILAGGNPLLTVTLTGPT